MGLVFLLGLSIIWKIGSTALMYYAFGPAAMKDHEKAFVEKYGNIKPPEVVQLGALDETDVEFLSKICGPQVKKPPSVEHQETESTSTPATETRYVAFRNKILDHLILAEVIPCNDEFVAIGDTKEEHCILLLRKTKPVQGFEHVIFYFNERVCHKPGDSRSFWENCRMVLSQIRVFLYTKVLPSEKSGHTVDKKDEEQLQPDDDPSPLLEEAKRLETALKDEPAAVVATAETEVGENSELRHRSKKAESPRS